MGLPRCSELRERDSGSGTSVGRKPIYTETAKPVFAGPGGDSGTQRGLGLQSWLGLSPSTPAPHPLYISVAAGLSGDQALSLNAFRPGKGRGEALPEPFGPQLSSAQSHPHPRVVHYGETRPRHLQLPKPVPVFPSSAQPQSSLPSF